MSRTVLLVEDGASDQKLALLAFKRCGIPADVVVAPDGAVALDYLFATGAHAGRDVMSQPQLVLLDLKLPKVGGLEVLERVRADPRTRAVPVVVLTASKEAQDLERSYALGANAYVRKPVDFVEFRETVAAIATFWLRINEISPPGRP